MLYLYIRTKHAKQSVVLTAALVGLLGWVTLPGYAWSWAATSGSNSGNGTANYSVAANTDTNSRMGTLAVAEQTFAVTQAATPISCGQTILGNISSVTQQDVYTFSGNDDEAVKITALATVTGRCAFAELFNSSGERIKSTSCNGSTGSFPLPVTDIYTIRVSADGDSAYNVNLQFTTGRCGVFTSCGQTQSGNLVRAQQDAYTFNGNAGEAVKITALATTFGRCVFARLFDPSGRRITVTSCNKDSNRVVLPATGVYTILVSADNNSAYNVNLQFETGRCATPISCGQTLSGNISSVGQHDTYMFNGAADEAIRVTAVGSSCVYTELFDPAGNRIKSTGCNKSTGRVVLPATGVYIILVSADHTSAYNVNLQSMTEQCGVLIFGRATDANSNGLSNLSVTLSGPLTQITQTDADGNYSFANLTIGGNYTVRLANPYFVFTPNQYTLENLSETRTADFAAVPQAVPTPTPPLSDDFDDSQRDPNRWNLGTLTQPLGAFDPQVSVVQQNGRLVITPRSEVDSLHYNGYVSANSFDFANATANVEVVQAATNGAETIFGIGSDNNNYFRFVVGMGHSPTFAPFAQAALAKIGILEAVMPALVFQVKIAGVLTQKVIPYDPLLHRFWRFRHDGPMNAILFETSPDNNDSTYREQHRVALQKSVSAMAVELSAGTAVPVSGSGSAQFDNFSLMTGTAQFSLTDFSVTEGAGLAIITVTRAGNVSFSPGTITYATVDNPDSTPCDPNARDQNGNLFPRGTAYERCDYATTIGTLTFAVNETTKTFTVPIIDDAYVEGNETLSLILLNSNSASVGVPGMITLTISDNDTQQASNPIFVTEFFVRQQYLDFLNREPEPDAFNNVWTKVLRDCSDVNNNPECDRIRVSSSFFLSPEFRLKGFFVFTFYRVAFGRLPEYVEIIPDMASVTGQTPTEVFQKRAQFPISFAARQEFKSRYDALSDTQYVATLLARYGLQQLTTPDPLNPEGGTKLTLTRADLANRLGAQGAQALTRAQVLRGVVESDEVAAAEFNNAFVGMQYYGYLRRTPEPDGYQAWLRYLTANPTDFRTMVNGFMNSVEYRLRFGNSNQ